MAQHYTCDRCREPIPRGRTSWMAMGSAFNDDRDHAARLPTRDFDLCPECSAALREWLKPTQALSQGDGKQRRSTPQPD